MQLVSISSSVESRSRQASLQYAASSSSPMTVQLHSEYSQGWVSVLIGDDLPYGLYGDAPVVNAAFEKLPGMTELSDAGWPIPKFAVCEGNASSVTVK
jgi:hypothetical protein